MQLRGASADALAAMREELDSALADGADAERLGEELFAVAQLLRAEPALRRVATDASIDLGARKGLAEQVLGGKVDPAVLALVGSAFGRRWTAMRDQADALEHLGQVATVKSAGSESGRLADELFAFGQTVSENPELRDALSDPARSTEDKATLVRSLVEGKALPATVALAVQALAGTYRTVSAALAAYQQVAAEVHGERVATVRVAHSLSEADRQRLAEALSRSYDRDIHLNVLVDPEVIGGMRVEIGDEVIDGTLASRLDEARRKLAG